MADPFPTKTRLELLRAVDAREVKHHWSSHNRPERDTWNGALVTARVKEAHAAGWIASPFRDFGTGPVYRWELTDAGRTVLEAADRG